VKKRRNILALLICCTLLWACNKQQKEMPVENGVSKELATYRKANISQLVYQLKFSIPKDKEEKILGENVMTFDLSSINQDLQIDFRESADHIQAVKCNGKTSAFRFENEHLIVPKSDLIAGSNKIEIDFIAGNTSLNRNEEFLYTLFVPDRARTAFPCFDQPDLKASFELQIEVPKEWKAMANGKLASQNNQKDRSIYTFARTKALPTYLFSFVAGKFETITREHKGRKHTLYHRETDPEKLANNTDEIFRLLFESLDWLEEYTDVPYPFAKYDIVAIPSFQYGGMEHTGATLYKASTLFLDKNPSQSRQLKRANLIAHETAHMWFGDLVTMKWFDQVWLKEVFANFLADKITNPSFPDVNHKLKFQMAHFPSSYSVDRTSGANPINQILPNLKDAGTVYGSIIYHKSPIVMNMLENITGEKALQQGLQKYLKQFAYGNATWEDLIAILDETTEFDLKNWSKVWVDRAGRPQIHFNLTSENGIITKLELEQRDREGNAGNWTQDLEVILGYQDHMERVPVTLKGNKVEIVAAKGKKQALYMIPNGKGNAYGLFVLDPQSKHYLLENIHTIKDDLARGIAWINLFENLRAGNISGLDFVQCIEKQIAKEDNTLIQQRILSYLSSAYWHNLSEKERKEVGEQLEKTLWKKLNREKNMGRKASLFSCYRSICESPKALEQLLQAWKSEDKIAGLQLSESKATSLASHLAIKMPSKAEGILSLQLERIKNPDRKKRMEFVAPSLSPKAEVRKAFFESLSKAENREHEPWVCEALRNLHHPLRQQEALEYLPKNLELLQEIQFTGDIFFPKNWLSASYSGHQSKEAGQITREFLHARSDYPENLKLKILQAADLVLKK
jgi:aminopeptidase N